MKRITALLLAALMIFALLPAAHAAETGVCGENVTWTLEGDTLTISGTGEMDDYVEANSPWYASRMQVRTIVVEEGITSIGDRAFRYHTNTLEARLPSTLKEIGTEAFLACYALEIADLPAGLEHIRSLAFSNCLKLDGVELPEGLKTLETRTFQHTGIRSIAIPETITILPEYTFLGCKNLAQVRLHDGITAIQDFCFDGTLALKTIDLPEHLTAIEWGCFSGSGLESIAIPEGVTMIESYAFSQCASLTQVDIPDTVKTIGDLAFRGTVNLRTIELPADLKETSHGLFSGSGLQSIALPQGLVTVGEDTFYDCDALTDVTIPDSVRYMEDYCFRDCNSLTTLELSPNTKKLGWGMFQDSGLQTITIPASCTYTEDYVFSGCNDLQRITYLGEDLAFGDLAFRDCKGPAEIDLPAGLTKVSYGMFMDSTVERIILPDTVTEIAELAFCNCDRLTEVQFPDAMTELGNYLFRDCDTIETLRLPAALKAIPWGLFWNSSLRELSIPDGVTTIHNQAFWDCEDLEKLVVPRSVVTVGRENVFENTPKLTIWCWADSFIHRYAEENGIPYVLMEEEIVEPVNPFQDVREGDFFYESVLWALEQGITTGTSEDTFAPENPCQRGQVVTFLWRAMGCPEPKILVNPFTDVSADAYYHDAVLWALEQGVTTGLTDTTFGPEAICNRAQVVTFLHRALGKPGAQTTENPFHDVAPGTFFYDAVLWAASAGVTSGVEPAVFAPEASCNRAQVVTFLYRAFVK